MKTLKIGKIKIPIQNQQSKNQQKFHFRNNNFKKPLTILEKGCIIKPQNRGRAQK
jgi:hypothetical protein